MSLFRRGKVFHYAFTLRGIRYRGSTHQTTKTAADSHVAALRTKLLEQGPDAILRRAPRLADFKPQFFEWATAVVANGRRKETTKRYYENGWKLIDQTILPSLTLDQITRDLVSRIQWKGSPAYVNQAIRTLRRMLGKAEERKLISRAPALELLHEEGRQHVLDQETERALLAHAGPTLRDVIIVIRDCGMRPDEIFRMRFENVDWNNLSYFNAAGKTRKSRRWLPISDRMHSMLMVRAKGEKSGWVFPSKRSKSEHVTTVAKMFRIAREAAGLPEDLVLYCGRHAFGTEAYRKTKNLYAVADAMGHTDLKTTRRYQHQELDEIRDAINERNNAQEVRVM
jgi:integrase